VGWDAGGRGNYQDTPETRIRSSDFIVASKNMKKQAVIWGSDSGNIAKRGYELSKHSRQPPDPGSQERCGGERVARVVWRLGGR